jgi:hypothetical protein
MGRAFLNEVTFASDSQLEEIHGFQRCILQNRIEVPVLVNRIAQRAFFEGRLHIFPSRGDSENGRSTRLVM